MWPIQLLLIEFSSADDSPYYHLSELPWCELLKEKQTSKVTFGFDEQLKKAVFCSQVLSVVVLMKHSYLIKSLPKKYV